MAICEALGDGSFDLIDDPMRFSIINCTGGSNQLGVLWILGNYKPGIDRDTMTAYTRTGLKNTDAGMAIG